MEYSGKYGSVELKTMKTERKEKYVIKAKIRENEYYIETDDREFAFNLFAKFAGKVGAKIEPDVIKVEITKNKKIIVHLGKWLNVDNNVEYAVFMNTITPYGNEEDVYLPASGVIRSFVVDLRPK